MKPYQPSNKLASNGLTWLSLSSVIGGVVIGGLAHLISLVVYLIILFPIGMGFLGGVVMAGAVDRGKVRNPAIAALFGALTGLILYGSMHLGGYLQFKQEASKEITKALNSTTDAQNEQLIDAYLADKTGDKGFWGYMKYSAQEGVSIGRVGSKGSNLGETGTWFYWIIELCVIDLMIAAIAYSAAKKPFCESCNQWYQGKERIGSINPQSSENFLQLLQTDQFSQAGKLVNPLAGTYAPNLEVYLQSCPTCKLSDQMMTVSAISLDSKGNLQSKEVTQGMLSPHQGDKFRESVTATLATEQEQNPDVTEEQMRLAQQERSMVAAGDRFESHGLKASQEADLAQQLARYPQVKEAYLVRKTVQYLPEKPFYVLGILRRKGLIDSEATEPKLFQKLMSELKLPGQTWIVFLNKDKPMLNNLQQTAGKAFYQKR